MLCEPIESTGLRRLLQVARRGRACWNRAALDSAMPGRHARLRFYRRTICCGSLAFARVVPASFHPLQVFAAMELATGLIAGRRDFRRSSNGRTAWPIRTAALSGTS
jgi:hypothetical protein